MIKKSKKLEKIFNKLSEFIYEEEIVIDEDLYRLLSRAEDNILRAIETLEDMEE